MKTNLNAHRATLLSPAKPGGAALIIVLAFLVLIAALVLAFFTSVSTELTGAKHYASGSDAKQLADSAVQEVMGTIKLATSGTTTGSSVVAWASQPGMIRTFDSTGKLLSCYKLYSTDNTVVTTETVNPAADYDPTWASKPALFTDLNSPVVTGTATLFPIIDGNAMTTLTKTPSGSTTPAYYGYDANGDGLPDVQGFSVNPALVNYTPGNPLSPTNTPVPMPVKWLYMLQDGTLTAPDSTSGTVATFNNAPTPPSPSNPITGRIAYWTDDDSCKVNINTASQGTYSDTPRSNSTEDVTLAVNQPLNHEFQRYPGHPATTSLSPVFSTWWQGLSAAQVTALNEKIYGIIPRVAGGGSMGGTVATTGTSTSYTPITLDTDRLYASLDELMFTPLLSGFTRVTQGFTEAQLQQSRFFITSNSRSPDVNLFNKPRVCIWPVSDINDSNHRTAFDQVFAFCSTVNTHPFFFQRDNPDSPTNDLPNTVANDDAPTGVERNRMLLDYLHYLSSQPIPGFGGNFQAKYSTPTLNVPGTGTDCDQILTEIFDYIRCTNLSDPNLASPSVPFTSSGASAGQGQVVPIQDNVRGTRGFGRFPTVDKAFFMFIGNAQNPAPTAAHMFVQPTAGEMNYYDPNANPTGVVGTSPTGAASSGNLRVQMGFFMNFFTPSQGHIFIYPKFKVEVDGLDQFSWGPLPAQTGTITIPPSRSNPVGYTVIRTASAPTLPSTGTFTTTPPNSLFQTYLSNNAWRGGNLGFASEIIGKGTTGAGAYPFVTSTTTTTGTVSGVVTATTSDMSPTGNIYFSGGNVTIKIYNAAGDTVVQTLTMNFPASPAGGFPVPLLAPSSTLEGTTIGSSENGTIGNFRSFVAGTTTIDSSPPVTATGGRLNSSGIDYGTQAAPCSWIIDNDVVRSVEAASGDPRLQTALTSVPSTYFAPNINYSNAAMMAHSLRSAANHAYYGATLGKLVQLALNQDSQANGLSYYNTDGKYTGTAGSDWSSWNPVFDYGNPGHPYPAPASDPGVLLGGSTGTTSVLGDWDNGFGNTPDGPYINKPDEGDGNRISETQGKPYFEGPTSQYSPETTTFSPNRQIPSAVNFGSLPTGVFANKPWQTLLFRPLPIGHPGLGTSTAGGGDVGPPYTTPPDHLFLDLFNMPVVEPYAISEPLSTAGRINMNYQIVPFTYINRATGIYAVMNAEKVIAIPDNQSSNYKGGSLTSIRFPINMDETLKGFTARFNNNDIFRSASEICSISLVPQDTDPNATYATMPAYWWRTGAYTSPAQPHRLTGDNSRERPYATIYPRLTTKSNTYTVHFRVQILKKVPGSSATTWTEAQDQVLSEFRGSQTIERYVDASDTTIPDYANPSVYNSTDPTINPPIDQFYKFRVLNSKQFAP